MSNQEPLEEDFYEKLKAKGYNCDCNCRVHQIQKLGLKAEQIPDLNQKRRIGVAKRIRTRTKKIKGEDKKVRFLSRGIVLENWKEDIANTPYSLVVILEPSNKEVKNLEQLEKYSEEIIKFIPREDKELNSYYRDIIKFGIKSLFESEKNFCWNKNVYLLYNVDSTGKSSGVPLLLAFYSSYYQKPVPDKIVATGKIKINDGDIEGVGGIEEKTIRVIKSKLNFIVPEEDFQLASEVFDNYKETNKESTKIIPANSYKDLINLLHEWNKLEEII